MFASLREIRPWGPADRLSDETVARWRERMEDDAGALHRIEVELWFRENETNRAAAYRRVAEVVVEAGGTIEAGEGIPVYEEVRARLAVPVTP